MNKIKIIFLFSLIGNLVFSQKKNEVVVTGTVYVTSSVSNGAIGYNSSSEGPHTFRKQTIYFKNDSISVTAKTDSLGIFSVQLKEGQYTVYQESGLTNKKDGLNNFGTEVIEVKKGSGPYKIAFHNSSNRRAAMNSGGGLPGTKSKKKVEHTVQNK